MCAWKKVSVVPPRPDSALDGIVGKGIKWNWSLASARVGAVKNPLQAVLLCLSSLLWGTDGHISGGLLFARLHPQKVTEASWPPLTQNFFSRKHSQCLAVTSFSKK